MSGIQNIMSLKLQNTSCVIYQIPSNSSDEIHSHKDLYQISIPIAGEPIIQCDQTIGKYHHYERIVISPEMEHKKFAGNDTTRLLVLFIQKNFLLDVFADRVQRKVAGIEFVPRGKRNSAEFVHLTERIIHKMIQSDPGDLQMSEMEFQLSHLLLTHHEGSHSTYWTEEKLITSNPAFNRIVEYLHDNVTSSITLDELAEESSMSKSYLIRLFQKHFGTTPAQYLTDIRLHKAAGLLKSSDRDITHICFEVGFGSVSTFDRSFKKKFGVTPRDYRSAMTY